MALVFRYSSASLFPLFDLEPIEQFPSEYQTLFSIHSSDAVWRLRSVMAFLSPDIAIIRVSERTRSIYFLERRVPAIDKDSLRMRELLRKHGFDSFDLNNFKSCYIGKGDEISVTFSHDTCISKVKCVTFEYVRMWSARSTFDLSKRSIFHNADKVLPSIPPTKVHEKLSNNNYNKFWSLSLNL